MDPGIWSRLPEHILDLVLSFLPLTTFLGLRSTCKHFSSLLFSPCFLLKHSLSSSSFPSFIFLSHLHFEQECPLYNTTRNSWCNIPLTLPPCSPSSNLLTSSNGLLCFSNTQSSCFVVYNLLSKFLQRVAFPERPFKYELLTFVSQPNGFYKLFMLSYVGKSSIVALIYDSASQSWQQYERYYQTINVHYHEKGAFHKGRLYFTTTPQPYTVVSFDLDVGNWEKSTARMPNHLNFIRVISDDDDHRKLYMVGGVGEAGISRKIKIWEMSEDGENWIEIESMPEMIFRKFVSVCYHNYEHVYCFVHQGLICLCCVNWPEILYFKMCNRIWYWLPKCPSLPNKWSCGFHWFPFKPRFF